MNLSERNPNYFQDTLVPEGSELVGLAALTHALGVAALVRHPAVIAARHVRGNVRTEGAWRIYDKRYEPGDTVGDHLTFALRHEDLDLLVLKRVFEALPTAAVEAYVSSSPMGATARRAWFLYEFLMDRDLDLPDAPRVTAVPVLDPKRYYTLPGELSRRHRVHNNLLGTPRFCPIIRRTPVLEALQGKNLAGRAREAIGRVSAPLVARAASFLLLADSRASFEIEGERPPRTRLERWAQAVLQAGTHPISLLELNRLHGILLADNRFVQPGLRPDGVFLGERTRDGEPMPEFIGARAEDLEDLLGGLVDADFRMGVAGLDPVIQAAATAFGFVYVHPYQDGNGRLHRCLIHHVLAERHFSPPGLVFPVSSVMLDRIDAYRATLQAHSKPLMPFIAWRPTAKGNVEVLNDTDDLYRYFDCTEAAEFLYHCVERTIEQDLPRELDYLRRHGAAMREIMEVLEMPDRLAEDLILYVRENGGQLSLRRRRGPFSALTEQEVSRLEGVVRDAFDGFGSESSKPK